MRLFGAGLEFRMELTGDKKRMVFQLDHFYDSVVRRQAAKSHAVLLKRIPILIINLISVAVPLINQSVMVNISRFGSRYKYTWIFPRRSVPPRLVTST